MRLSAVVAISVSSVLMLAFGSSASAQTPEKPRISGPVVHENLAVYFIHGQSASGKVPLTLEEAMAKGLVQVRETSNVNQLEIENLSNEEVFVQSGDIVKGGKQDRTLMVSLVLPPKSGRIPIASFCVEEGRWSARGREDAGQFSTASAAVPSREMKLAMKAPRPAPAGVGQVPANGMAPADTGERQQQVWNGVRTTQMQLAGSVGAPVNSSQSTSSLQLALENEKLIDIQRAYVKALKPAGEADGDIVGYVFAVNGKINSADIYPSHGLFRKMWTKLLNASATEAIMHKNEPRGDAPEVAAIMAFLADAEGGKPSEKPLNAGVKLEVREGQRALFFETARNATPAATPVSWVHRNYLAK